MAEDITESLKTEWVLPLFLEAYQAIAMHGKNVEGRVPDPSKPEKNYGEIIVGDTVLFRAVDRTIQPTGHPDLVYPVTFNLHYPDVTSMLVSEGLRNVLPGVKTIEEGVRVYHSLPDYAERIEKNGIHAIGLGKRIS